MSARQSANIDRRTDLYREAFTEALHQVQNSEPAVSLRLQERLSDEWELFQRWKHNNANASSPRKLNLSQVGYTLHQLWTLALARFRGRLRNTRFESVQFFVRVSLTTSVLSLSRFAGRKSVRRES